MAETIISNVVLRLPLELRLMIYSFMFLVDFEALRKLLAKRDYIREHLLPPHDVCLQEPLYVQYREHPGHRQRLACWPEDVEEAFFKACEDTKPGEYRVEPSPRTMLVGGEQSPWVPVLQRRGVSCSQGRNTIVSEIVRALTGKYRNRKQVSSHIQIVKGFTRSEHVPHCRMEDILFRIVALAALKEFAMHDALYRLLQHATSSLEWDAPVLEIVTSSISPAFREAVAHVQLHCAQEDHSRRLELLHRKIDF